ncbi:MAG: hypothetical protein V4719_00785 [Planctomycetota bacterium]
MAITAKLDIKGRSGRPYLGTDTEVTVPYIVYTDDPTQGETAIRDSDCLPARGDAFDENAYLAAYQLTLKREDSNPLMWRANITFKTDSMDQKEKDKILFPDPTKRPAEVEWDAVGYQVPAVATVEDYTPPGAGAVVKAGSPVVNSAWDWFDPPAEKTDYHWVCTVTKMIPAAPVWLLDIPGTVNNTDFVIDGLAVPQGYARITGLRIGRRQRENGFNYREMKISIEFRRMREARSPGEEVPTPWILELENVGYNSRSGSTYLAAGADSERILDANDKPVPTPVYLDINGDEAIGLTPTTTTKRHFKIYRTSDFTQLPLE